VRVDERCGKDDLPPFFCDAATRFYLVNSPRLVVQLNDRIDGQQVTDFNAFPSHPELADAYEVTDSTPPSERGAGDHLLAFVVKTTGGDMVVRASHMDTDRDGLPDHWETHGIDMDRDGAIDLDLPAMGADPLRRDLFIEVDWLAPDAATGRDFAPQPEALTFLANLFANAPLANPDGSTGITAHIDAGDSCWLNMQPADALNTGALAVGSCGPDTDTNRPGSRSSAPISTGISTTCPSAARSSRSVTSSQCCPSESYMTAAALLRESQNASASAIARKRARW
jgi:hypothetical protein